MKITKASKCHVKQWNGLIHAKIAFIDHFGNDQDTIRCEIEENTESDTAGAFCDTISEIAVEEMSESATSGAVNQQIEVNLTQVVLPTIGGNKGGEQKGHN